MTDSIDTAGRMAVGVTGHRLLDHPEALRSTVDGILARLRGSLSTHLVIVSSLAEGADRLVAHAGLAAGAELRVVLPMPVEEYETDFAEADSRSDFHRLLSVAHAVETVPPCASRAACYEAAGRRVLDRSSLLVAVWDGEAARGQGGTAEIVAEARRRCLPIAWIRPSVNGGPAHSVVFERLPGEPP